MATYNYSESRRQLNSSSIQYLLSKDMYPDCQDMYLPRPVDTKTGKTSMKTSDLKLRSKSNIFTVLHSIMGIVGSSNLYQAIIILKNEENEIFMHTSNSMNWIATSNYFQKRFNILLTTDGIKSTPETKTKTAIPVELKFEIEQLDLFNKEMKSLIGRKIRFEAANAVINEYVTTLPGGLFSNDEKLNDATQKIINEANIRDNKITEEEDAFLKSLEDSGILPDVQTSKQYPNISKPSNLKGAN